MKVTVPAAQRFWSKVEGWRAPGEQCWLWLGSKSAKGYGTFKVKTGHTMLAHKWAWERIRGPVPSGLELDHLCRVHNCVRPSHMEEVTHLTNVRRGLKGVMLTHCKRGHPLDKSGSVRITPSGRRVCRLCRNENARNRRRLSKGSP